MKLIIKKIHIFDIRIQDEFREFIKLNKDKLDSNKCYTLILRYNAKTVLENDNFDFNNSIYNNVEIKFKDENKEYKALRTQLEKCTDILKENGIECYDSTIEGDSLKNNDVKIILEEDKSEPAYTGRGKNKRRIGMSSVMPNKEYTINTISKFFNERMSKIYSNLSNNISNEIMCKILDIEYTEDENKIYKAFCDQYGDLWICNEKRAEELKQKLINRVKLLCELEKEKQKGANAKKA